MSISKIKNGKLSVNEVAIKIAAQKNSENLGLDALSLSKTEAQILQRLVLFTVAEKVVEIGTLATVDTKEVSGTCGFGSSGTY